MSESLKNMFAQILQKRSYFMSFIGWTIITITFSISTYIIVQSFYFFGKGKLTFDELERIITAVLFRLFEITMVVILFFYKREEKITE